MKLPLIRKMVGRPLYVCAGLGTFAVGYSYKSAYFNWCYIRGTLV